MGPENPDRKLLLLLLLLFLSSIRPGSLLQSHGLLPSLYWMSD